MGKIKTAIPVHDFTPEDDLGDQKVRYVPLHVKNNYDFMEPHRHNYYEIFLFRKGGGHHLVDFVEHKIYDHCVQIIGPGQVHLLKRAPGSYGSVIHFHPDMLVQLPQAGNLLHTSGQLSFSYADAAYNAIEVISGQLRDELDAREQNRDILVACLWHLLLKVSSGKPAQHMKFDTRSYQIFSQFKQLVEQHYRDNNLPAWYAEQMHITEKRLNEACKEATGQTVSSFLQDRIILEAKRLLSHSAGSVKEIAYYLGFDDPSYFARFFRKNTGMTAGDFKKKYQ